ncbi:hypothetical protein ACQW02_08405 [Humitalea sp. 24SJ18S-53]|uniref:hypothetical protein n=1 Tax=Humitalea sp. 24SJ18S-53 TaxID=3422307 RepID=UPI003D675A53
MRLTLTGVVIGFLIATTVGLFGQKAGFWGRPTVRVVAVAPVVAPPVPAPVAVPAPAPVPAPVAAPAPVPVAAPAPAPVVAAAAPSAPPTGEETVDILPEGPGREETFLACTACHSTALIRRSGFNRESWDGLMDWMVEKQAMNPLDPDMRRVIVDYLAASFPPRSAPRGRGNPFATQ